MGFSGILDSSPVKPDKGILENNQGTVPTDYYPPIKPTIQPYQIGYPVGRCVVRIASRIEREGEVSAERNGLLYETLRRKYTRKYNVWTNHHLVGQSQILQTIGVPYVGGQYPFGAFGDTQDALATCVSVKCSSTTHPKFWVVTAEFDTDRIITQITDNPLLQPADFVWDAQPFEQPMRYDYYGVPCNSSAGNQFDPPAMVEQMRTILRITRNEALTPINDPRIHQYDGLVMEQYRRKLNYTTLQLDMNGVPIPREGFFQGNNGTRRVNSITSHRMLTNGILHAQVVYEVEFRILPDSFIEQYLDQDYRDANGIIFRDKRDQLPFQNQTPLNGRGDAIYNAVTILQNGLLASKANAQDTIAILPADKLKFPKAPQDPINPFTGNPDPNGIIIGPDQFFFIRIQNEVLQVIAGAGNQTWTVLRGQRGTQAVAHAALSQIKLEPYFLRFIPNGYIDFSPLNLDGANLGLL